MIKMQSFKAIYLLTFIFCLVLSDPPTTQINFDPVGTAAQNNSSLLKWVEHKAEVTYTYGLIPDYKFHQFPDLAITVNIPIGQRVLIEYNIQTYFNAGSSLQFWTRVLINGQERNKVFRLASGYTHFHSHEISRQMWLDKGTYSIQVQYLTLGYRSGGMREEPYSCAILNVGYYIQ